MAKKKSVKEATEVLLNAIDNNEDLVKLDKIFSVVDGKGVGVYYNSETKRYVMVTLNISSNTDEVTIIAKKDLKASKLSAILEADIKLKQLLERELK